MEETIIHYIIANIRDHEYLTRKYEWEECFFKSRAYSFKRSRLQNVLERAQKLPLPPVSVIKLTYELSPKLKQIRKRVIPVRNRTWEEISEKLFSCQEE